MISILDCFLTKSIFRFVILSKRQSRMKAKVKSTSQMLALWCIGFINLGNNLRVSI